MMSATQVSLPPPHRAGIMGARVKSATLLALYLLAGCAFAQQQPQQPQGKRDDLDVTMQIIVDPDAKLPDEVVRRIPLPERKAANPSEQAAGKKPAQPDAAAAGKESAREAKELGREMSDSAKQRAQDAAEQREQARRSAAEERRRNPPGPPETPPRPPGPPPRP
jgi:hypothetical protein